jgi:hypothetical protein
MLSDILEIICNQSYQSAVVYWSLLNIVLFLVQPVLKFIFTLV